MTVATLQKLGDWLVDIHGQHEGRALLEPARQRELLDAYGGLGEKVCAYRQARQTHETLRRKRQELIESADARAARAGAAGIRARRAAAADPKPGEYDELARAGQLAAKRRADPIDGRGGLLSALRGRPLGARRSRRGSRGRSSRSRRPRPELARGRQRHSSGWPTRPARSPSASASLAEGWDDDPARLEDIETRLALYRRLATRFHCTPDELADRLASTELEARAARTRRSRPAGARAPLAEAWAALEASRRRADAGAPEAGQGLRARHPGRGSSRWASAAARLSVAVETRELGDDPLGTLPPESGADRVEMLFSANPGEDPRPLRKIASGGELSRVTLAVKTGAGGRRSRAHARLRRDRHRRRRPARLGTGQDARRAGSPPSSHLRDPPAPDGQLCRSAVGDPQAGRARPVAHHDHAARRSGAQSKSSRSCSAANRPPRGPARRPWPCCGKLAAHGEGWLSDSAVPWNATGLPRDNAGAANPAEMVGIARKPRLGNAQQ